MNELVQLLKELGFTIASCESLTGGMFASEITSIAGVSKVYKGSIVSYCDEAKEVIVGVNKSTIDSFGAISQQTALEMALRVKELFNVDVAISFTGNAGPGIAEDKAVGLVYSAIVIKDEVYDYCDLIDKERNELRKYLVELSCTRLLTNLNKYKEKLHGRQK